MKRTNYFPAIAALFLCLSLSLPAQEFVNAIKIPPLISSDDTDYHLNVIETQHNFNPMGSDSLNTMVPTFAFEDANYPGTTTILGPSIAWQFGKMLTPKVTNNIGERTTCHWHGAHVPQSADGGPHQIIMPDSTWSPVFEVKDKSATMWYHPHAMGLTYEHVQMGLSGMIYVEDPEGVDPILDLIHDILPIEYSVDDIPLVFQTKKFERNNSGDIQIQSVKGFKNNYYYMVNGIVDPVLQVPADMIRLRYLNGDGKFSFNLSVRYEDGTTFPSQLIATDAGYTDRSYQLPEILMSPGERTEWLLDLRGLQGEVLYIHNNVSGIPTGIIGDSATTGGYAVNRDLLKIEVGPSTQPPSPIISFPIPLHPLETPDISDVSKTRLKTFRKDSFLVDNQMQFLFNIDSTLMDMMVVNDVVKLDSTEIWTIDNTTNIGHPWHIHDIHFWVTEIIENGTPLNPADYPWLFRGPKDNVLVMPGWKLSYITTFSDYGTEIQFDSSYMFHCHILPHEDRGMMGQFVVWNGLGDPNVSTEDPVLSTRQMKLFPNPTQDFVYLEGASEAASRVHLLDLQGRLLRAIPIPRFDGIAKLDLSGLPKGMIIVDWQSQEGKAVSKIVID